MTYSYCMGIRGEEIQASLRDAEIREILDSDRALMADLRSVLTPGAIRRGVQIQFGPDRSAFSEAIRALGIPDLVSPSDSMHVQLAEINTRAAYEELPAQPLLDKDFNPIDTLEIMHRVNWQVFTRNNLRGGLKSTFWPREEVCMTSISLTKLSPGARGGTEISRRHPHPIIILSALCQYAPGLEGNKYVDLPDYLADAHDELGIHPDTAQSLGHFANYLAYGKGILSMPETAYLLTVGKVHHAGRGITGANPGAYYELENGRLVFRSNGMFQLA
jgi:hypothetical protein